MVDDASKAIACARGARASGHLQEALADYTRAADTARADGLTTELIVALSGVAQIERDLGRSAAACARYLEVVGLCRRADDPMRQAKSLRHLADIHRERGRPDAAVESVSEALEIYRRRPDTSPLDLANALRVWALVQDAVGNSIDATNAWREARALYAAEGIDAGVSECDARLDD